MSSLVEPENGAQRKQIRESTFRQFNRMVKTDSGERAWLIIAMLVVGAFSAWTGYNWGWNDAATPWRHLLRTIGVATYDATIENRCVGLAIMAADYPDQPTPDWCVEPLRRARVKPQPLPAPEIDQ